MHSSLPKPLHTVAGIPMIERVLRAGAAANPSRTVVVVSAETADLVSRMPADLAVTAVRQDPPRGTGDATLRALAELPEIDKAIVLFSDHPLLASRSVTRLLDCARQSCARVTILSAPLPDAAGFGRVERDGEGRVTRIVERRDDDMTRRRGVVEINTGMMVLDAAWAHAALRALEPSAATGELYLTGLVDRATGEAAPGAPWPVASVQGEPDDAIGVNDRVDLAAAEVRAWERKREALMRAGVTLRLPETIVVDEDVSIGPDTVVLPYCELLGATTVGGNCLLGPSAVIRDSVLGDRVVVRSSTVEASRVADDADVGPYSHLRSGCEIGPRVHIGNFAELKNARLDTAVKVGHFSYIGDATVGPETNVGAGAVTANYDGHQKYRTEIGARAFIGSDTILRAPVSVGDDARTGAGSVVTKDVPSGATVVGVPARIVRRTVVDGVGKAEEE